MHSNMKGRCVCVCVCIYACVHSCCVLCRTGLTFVSGAESILNCLIISIRVILVSMRARRIPMHCLGPTPKGMCAQGCLADLWALSNLHQKGTEEQQWQPAGSETAGLQQHYLSGLNVFGSGHRSSL